MESGRVSRRRPMAITVGTVVTHLQLRFLMLFQQTVYLTKERFKLIQALTIRVRCMGMGQFGVGELIQPVNLAMARLLVRMFLFKFQVSRMRSV